MARTMGAISKRRSLDVLDAKALRPILKHMHKLSPWPGAFSNDELIWSLQEHLGEWLAWKAIQEWLMRTPPAEVRREMMEYLNPPYPKRRKRLTRRRA